MVSVRPTVGAPRTSRLIRKISAHSCGPLAALPLYISFAAFRCLAPLAASHGPLRHSASCMFRGPSRPCCDGATSRKHRAAVLQPAAARRAPRRMIVRQWSPQPSCCNFDGSTNRFSMPYSARARWAVAGVAVLLGAQIAGARRGRCCIEQRRSAGRRPADACVCVLTAGGFVQPQLG